MVNKGSFIIPLMLLNDGQTRLILHHRLQAACVQELLEKFKCLQHWQGFDQLSAEWWPKAGNAKRFFSLLRRKTWLVGSCDLTIPLITNLWLNIIWYWVNKQQINLHQFNPFTLINNQFTSKPKKLHRSPSLRGEALSRQDRSFCQELKPTDRVGKPSGRARCATTRGSKATMKTQGLTIGSFMISP